MPKFQGVGSGLKQTTLQAWCLLLPILVISVLLFSALLASAGFFVLLLAYEVSKKIKELAHANLEPGDFVVYRKQKISIRPGPRAYEIHPAGQGESYTYFVDKLWTVANVLHDGRILATTRTGKHHYLRAHDPNLRKAGLMARLRYRDRFPQLPA